MIFILPDERKHESYCLDRVTGRSELSFSHPPLIFVFKNICKYPSQTKKSRSLINEAHYKPEVVESRNQYRVHDVLSISYE